MSAFSVRFLPTYPSAKGLRQLSTKSRAVQQEANQVVWTKADVQWVYTTDDHTEITDDMQNVPTNYAHVVRGFRDDRL